MKTGLFGRHRNWRKYNIVYPSVEAAMDKLFVNSLKSKYPLLNAHLA